MRLVANRKISIKAGNPYGPFATSVCSCAVTSIPGPVACGLSTPASPLTTAGGVAGITMACLGDVSRGPFSPVVAFAFAAISPVRRLT